MKNCPKCNGSFDEALTLCPVDAVELIETISDPLVGQFFAEQFEILSVLGRGGMSVVYKARHKLMDRIVAIKLLQGDAEELAVARFKLEAKAASSLNHPNIISVYDFGIIEKQAYLVMDYLEGTDLADILLKETRISEERAVHIFRQVCAGLEHAPKKGIIHRDLKPSNLCLIKGEDGNEHVKIVDFGIAKIISQTGKDQLELTQTGDIFGSPLYMSPEQCLSQPLDTRTDIYSLGCLMYESLTGVPPHEGDTTFSTMTRHVTGTPLGFDKIVPDLRIDKNLEAIVFRCLEKKREDRYQTAAEILADLPSSQLQSGSMKGKSVEHPSKRRQEMFALRLGFWTLLVFLAALFLYMSLDHGPNHDRGTVLQKTIWNAQTTIAQTLIDYQLYAPAQAILDSSEKTAREQFSNRGRLMTALLLERDLFKQAHMFEELEIADGKIADLNKQILLDSYDSTMQEIKELSQYKTETGKNINKLMSAITLRKIKHVSMALIGTMQDSHAETLLNSARRVYSDLLGKEDPAVAEIDILLADCYWVQEELSKVRPLLLEAVAILEKSKGMNDRKAIMALLRLGQLDRNENSSVLAKQELEKALKATEQFFPKDAFLRSLCMRSYADYLARSSKNEEAAKLYAKADEIYSAAGLDEEYKR